MRFRHLVLLLLLSFTLPAYGSDLSARLIIVGPGDPIYTYWGHIGIAIRNNDTGQDLFYDFGNFSFYSENFYRDFAMGRMLYLGYVVPTDSFISYSLEEDRDLVYYPMNLGDEELRELDDILRWWVLPENREYLYDYFLNNCSTIIRDIIDQITDGQLMDRSRKVVARSFRHYARTGAHESFAAETLLHFLLGPSLDEPIDGWDLMFLPEAVGDFALGMRYTGRDGITRTLAEEKVVLKSSSRNPVPDQPRTLFPGLFLIGVLLAALWWFTGDGAGGRIVKSLLIIVIGLPGLLLGFLMTFTDHAAAYGNVNIWPIVPTVLLALIPLFSSRWTKRREIMAGIWTINLTGCAVSMFLVLSGLVDQNAGAFWGLFTPIALAASYPGYLLKRRVNRSTED